MQIPSLTTALILLIGLVGSNGVRAEVIDAAAGGFTTKYSVAIDASRQQVYHALVVDIGRWWSDDHTVSGHASNLTIDARPMGCFCEKLDGGAGLVHMTVTFANPGVMLRMTGGLGPLGLMGIAGNMTFEINETDGVSDVILQYAVGGYMDGGLDQVAPAVDGVLVDVLDRLKKYVEADE